MFYNYAQSARGLHRLYQTLVAKAQGTAACVKVRTMEGCALTSTYSGITCPEISAHLISRSHLLAQDLGFVDYIACDVNSVVCFMMLSEKDPPMHIHRDLLNRLH